ncbi:hypothetical protein OG884_36435 [Streptosporangium sp. NBC_01755]|uniref:hypothetical protein n=1 Tax=unclassified Streptosporangium TaxID=2632669 RepID=UPI002DDB6A00|nr:MULTISPECIES: hypothetical protein [unclassified Streptosporangium]WSA28327.1 hypothetical protein OIE13_10895 [Streptosporangium sp. NBC_01810]WSD00195.1 hypothetical protein OG884_36435 [Streptosporangium sp. NBC_01755]
MSVHIQPSNVNPDGAAAPFAAAAPQQIRIAGVLLAIGATAWGAGTVIVGDKIQEGIQTLDTVTGMLFIVGVFALVRVVLATRGTGDGWSRVIPAGLLALLPGAFLLNVFSFGYATHDDFPLALMILDACWPLSMLGMLVQGIAVAVTGRYQGLLRWLPLLAGLWFPVTMLAQIFGGSIVSTYVSAAWLLGTYAHLGLRLTVRPTL